MALVGRTSVSQNCRMSVIISTFASNVPACTWLGCDPPGIQIGTTHPCPPQGGPKTAVFSAGYPRFSAGGWHLSKPKLAEAGLRPGNTTQTILLLAGDIETNPGPTYTCALCTHQITNRQISLLCNTTNTHWVHKSCTNITVNQYRQTNRTWTCALHTNTNTTQASNRTTSSNHTSPNTSNPQPAPITTTLTNPQLTPQNTPNSAQTNSKYSKST